MSFSAKSSFIWNGNDVKIRGKKIVNKSPYEAGLIIQGQAVALTPVDTGRLRGSIATKSKTKEKVQNKSTTKEGDIISGEIQENEAYVGTNVGYSPYIEYGTVKMSAQPFMRPAFDLSQGKTLEVFEKNGKQEFKDYFSE